MKLFGWKNGFTFPEIIIVFSILATLIGLTYVNATSVQTSSDINATVDTLVSDMKQQQLKSMLGDTEGRATHDVYGIFFGSSSYTLFHGATYNANDATNYTIPLGGSKVFVNDTFPSTQIIYTFNTGEVTGFVNGSNTITIKNSGTNQQKTITVNRFGAVTSVN